MITAIITAGATVLGSIIAGLVSMYVCTIQNDKSMALITYRLEQLEEKVDKHNNLVERMTAVETELGMFEDIVKKV